MFLVKVSTAPRTTVAEARFAEEGCLIGKAPDSGIVLQGWRVAPRHARLEVEASGVFLCALGQKNETRVNGQRVNRFGPLAREHVIEIDDYRLRLTSLREQAPGSDRPDPSECTRVAPVVVADSRARPDETREAELQGLRMVLRQKLHEQIDLRRVNVSAMSDEELRALNRSMR